MSLFTNILSRNVFPTFAKNNLFQKKNMYHFSIMNRERVPVKVTDGIELISDDNKVVHDTTFQLTELRQKPLLVLFPWLMAKPKSLSKFVNYYLDNGFDVLKARVTPFQVLWPEAGAHMVARNVLKFLKINYAYKPLVVHGFSASSYLWGEIIYRMAKEKVEYEDVKSRIAGQVWDSALPIDETCSGVATLAFPNNPKLRNMLQKMINLHVKVFESSTTRHYINSCSMLHSKTVMAPSLLFLSKKDPIGTEDVNRKLYYSWHNHGIKVHWKCWNDSPHVEHIRYHPVEYIEELSKFLISINAMDGPDQRYK